LNSQQAVIPGDLVQTLGPGAPHMFFETNPAQDDIPKYQAEKYPPKEEYYSLVP
jgi:hypothetical protein